jgi:hypothetical protein
MSDLFGNNPGDRVNPDNPQEKSIEEKLAPQPQGQPIENNSNEMEAQTEQRQNIDMQSQQIQQSQQSQQSQQTQQNIQENNQQSFQQESQQEEVQTENVNTDSEYEEKVEYIREKFESPEDFEKSVEELQKRLGRDENVSLNDQEEAIDYYIQLEKELGQTGNVEQTRQQNQMLKQQMQQIQSANQRLMAQMRALRNQGPNQQFNQQTQQNMQNQPRNNQGQFMANNNQQQQNQNNQQNQEVSAEDIIENMDLGIDSDEFLNDMYENGANSKNFKKAIAKVSGKLVDAKLNQQQQLQQQKQQKEQQEQQQQMQRAQQLNSHYKNQVQSLRQKYGEQEVNRHKDDMAQFFREHPTYLDPKIFPNGMQRAYQEVKKRRNKLNQQNQMTQQQSQMNVARKKTANMPQNSSNNRRFQNGNRNLSQNEIEKQQIFQQENTGGLFG